ncbi:AraC family transcriptional regulator [Alsobacter sp. R-9]
MSDRRTGEPGPDDALQRMSPLVGIPQLLAEFGVETAAMLEGLPLTADIFADPETRIPYSQICQLLQNGADLTGCPHFGLLLGARADTSVLGFAGQWMRNAPTLGASLTGFVAMQPSASRGGVVYMFPSDDAVYLGYGIYGQRTTGWQHLYPLVVGMANNVVRKLTGGQIKPIEVLLSLREPADKKPWLDVFKAPVHFNQPLSALVLPRRAMDTPIEGASPVDFSTLERKAAALMPPSDHVWTDRVRRVLRSTILEREPLVTVVAERLDVHVRTLRRHLAREGTTFQSVLDDLRYANARELLEVTDLSIGDIALALAYSTHAAFDTAFRRWSGMTPQRWRMALPPR